MTKEEFKKMFSECFYVEVCLSSYQGSAVVNIVDMDTDEVVTSDSLYFSDIRDYLENH